MTYTCYLQILFRGQTFHCISLKRQKTKTKQKKKKKKKNIHTQQQQQQQQQQKEEQNNPTQNKTKTKTSKKKYKFCWYNNFYRCRRAGRKRLPKFKFSAKFPIGLHVILQIQRRKNRK